MISVIYTLIMVLATSAGVAIEPLDFTDKTACETAARQYNDITIALDLVGSAAHKKRVAFCVRRL